MRKEQRASRQGFTLYELILVIAIIGILAAIAIPHYVFEWRSKVKVAEAKMEIRDLQELVVFYLGDTGELPTIENLSILYKGNESIIGRYKMAGDYPDDNRGHGNDWDGWDEDNPGNSHKPHTDTGGILFIIYTTRPIKGVNYVYAINDKAPEAAYKGNNPIGHLIGFEEEG